MICYFQQAHTRTNKQRHAHILIIDTSLERTNFSIYINNIYNKKETVRAHHVQQTPPGSPIVLLRLNEGICQVHARFVFVFVVAVGEIRFRLRAAALFSSPDFYSIIISGKRAVASRCFQLKSLRMFSKFIIFLYKINTCTTLSQGKISLVLWYE